MSFPQGLRHVNPRSVPRSTFTILGDNPLQFQNAIFALQHDMLNCFPPSPDKAALSFQPPEKPTLENFDRLLQAYGRLTFSTETDLTSSVELETRNTANAGETSRYKVEQIMSNTVTAVTVEQL